MERVTFLFGAGAEMCYGMKSGNDFLLDSVGACDNKENRLKSLGSFFSVLKNKKFPYQKKLVYSKEKFLQLSVYQKALDGKFKDKGEDTFYNNNKSFINWILSDEQYTELKREIEIQKENDLYSYPDTLKKEISNIFHKALANSDEKMELDVELEKILKNNKLKSKDISNIISLFEELFCKNKEGKYFLNTNLPSSGLLDSYFHTIIDPNRLGPVKFAKVFNYYWFCYMSMVDDIFTSPVIDTSKLQKYLNSNSEPDYKKILENISDFTKDIYSEKLLIENDDSYYTLIKKQFEAWEKEYKSDYKDPKIVTTNYFRFCEVLKKDPIYLNGNLKEFEFPETLEVKDLNHEIDLPDGIFFPFIWGQSYVKPIVHRKQIEQYTRFAKALEETDVLVILGYNINPDDNHINAFLREYVVREGTRAIVVVSKKYKKNVNEKLHLNKGIGNIEYCEVDYNEHSIGQIVYQLFQTMNLKDNDQRVMEVDKSLFSFKS